MTKLLSQAIEKVQGLSETEQDAIARMMLDEIESDQRWEELLERSSDALQKAGDAAWRDYEAGRTEPLDPDRL